MKKKQNYFRLLGLELFTKDKSCDCVTSSSSLSHLLTPKLIKMIFGLVWFMLVVDIDPYIMVVIVISFSLTQMCEMHSISVNTVKTRVQEPRF